MPDTITTPQMLKALETMCDTIENEKDYLSELDGAIGDGDHGVGMARGFEAVRQELEGGTFSTLDDLVKAVGMALMTSVGGAAGGGFGTLFRGGARRLGGRQVLDSETLSLMLLDGLDAVKARGKAEPGDKTMVDALEPAALRSQELTSAPLDESLAAISEGAAIIARLSPDDEIWITNNLPYIVDLEEGHSSQAPLGFVLITLRQIRIAYR